MDKDIIINMRGIDCSPDIENRFIGWYDDNHIPDLINTGEVEKIIRYERISDDKTCPKHLIFFEFKNKAAFDRYEVKIKKDSASGLEKLKKAFPQGGMDFKWRVQYKPVKTWVKGD